MALNRDIHVRFIVTDDDMAPKIKAINGSLDRMADLVKQAGEGTDKLTMAKKRQAAQAVQTIAKFEAYGRQIKQIHEMQEKLRLATGLSVAEEKRYAVAIEASKTALADLMVREQFLEQERANRRPSRPGGGGGGAIPSSGAASMEQMSRAGDSLIGTINKLSLSIFVLTFGTQQLGEIFLRTFVQAGEQVEQQRNRIDLLTKSTDTFGKVVAAATEVGVKLEDFGGSFARLAVANQQMKLTNDELVTMTKTLAQVGAIGGGTMQEISAAMQQFAQGMASGSLQGDELRSVLENMPYLALKLADGLKVGVGQLRAMGAAGELTGERVSGVILEISEDVNKLFQDLPVTSAQGLNRISTQWDLMINTMLRAGGIDAVGQMFTDWAASMEEFNGYLGENQAALATWLAVAGEVAKFGLALAGMFFSLRAAAGVGAAIQKATAALEAWRTASAAASQGAKDLAAGVILSAEAEALATARTQAFTAAKAALAPVLIGLTVAIGVAISMWSAYRNAQEEIIASGEKALKTFDDLGDRLDTLSRKELQALAIQLTQAREIKLDNIEKMKTDLQAFYEQMAEGGPVVDGAVQGQKSLDAATADLVLRIGEEERAAARMQAGLDTIKGTTNGTADAVLAAANAIATMSKEMTKLADDTVDAERKLRDLTTQYQLVAQLGEEAGTKAARRSILIQAHADSVAKTVEKFRASGDGADPTVLRGIIDARDKLLETNLKILDIEDARAAQQEAGRAATKTHTAATKAHSSATKDLTTDIKSQISAQQKLIDDSDKYIETLDKITDRAVELGMPDLERRSEADARAAAEERDRALAEKARRMDELAAVGDEAALKKIRMDEEDTARAKARTAEAEAYQAEITEREARNQELASLASSINSAMTASFNEMADGAGNFDDMLKRIILSIRDMIVQLTILKPLSEFLAGTITGMSGGKKEGSGLADVGLSLGKEIGASTIGKLIGALPFADGGVVGSTGLGHGVYSSPTIFPMRTPGVHAFASGTGLMGEAGPEAILPLSRGSGGKLGVEASGMAVNVVVNTRPGETANVSQDGNNLTIDIVENMLASRIARGGTALPRAMETSYAGMRRGGR